MNKKHRRILRYTLGGVLLGTSITAGMILAAPTPSRQTPLIVSSEKKGQIPIDRCELPPAVGGIICTPNARDYGYFEGTWRRWPTQTRMDQHNPGAVIRNPITPAGKHPEGTLSGMPEIYVPPQTGGMGSPLDSDQVTPTLPPVLDGTMPRNPPGTSIEDDIDIGIDIDETLFGDFTENGNGTKPPIEDPELIQTGGEMKVRDVIVGPAVPETGYTTPENGEFEPPSFPMPEMKSQEDLNRSIEGIVPGQDYEGTGYMHEANPLGALIPGMYQEPPATTPPPMPPSISTPTAAASPAPAPSLEGFCPVSLLQTEQWIKGDPRYQVTYNGKTYLLSSQEKVQEFLADPQRFTPVLDGNDPVEMQSGRQVGGLADFCLVYEGRLYMFASEDSMTAFFANAKDIRDYAAYTERLMQE